MDAQAMLVRYLRRELREFLATMTRRDQQSGFHVLQSGCAVLALVLGCMGTVVHAQPWGGPHPYPPTGYQTYAPSVDAAAYAALVPDRRQGGERLGAPMLEIADHYLSGSWVRLEYLNAKVGHSSGRGLGTKIRDIHGNIIDTTQAFDLDIFDPLLNDPLEPLTVRAVSPSTKSVDWDDIGGIRGSFGIPVDRHSWVEGSFMGLAEQNESLHAPTIPPTSLNPLFGTDPVQLILVPFTIDGQLGSVTNVTDLSLYSPASMIVYDAGFFSDYKVNVWSAEVNYVRDLRIPFDGWSVQSIIGYRHEEYSEQLTFGGSFDNRSGYATDGTVTLGQFATPISNSFDSKVHNYRNALQLGIRSELKQYGLTLGVEPKVAFGVGLIRSRVNTENAREPGDLSPILGDPNLIIDDPASTTDFDREFDFAPSAELNLYAKYDLTSWFKLRVGYNLTWMGRVGVADASIRYNTISAVDPLLTPDQFNFGVNQKVGSRYISAFTIGGEILLP